METSEHVELFNTFLGLLGLLRAGFNRFRPFLAPRAPQSDNNTDMFLWPGLSAAKDGGGFSLGEVSMKGYVGAEPCGFVTTKMIIIDVNFWRTFGC